MKKVLFLVIACLLFSFFCACGSTESIDETNNDESVPRYSVGAYYSTKRDKVYIYFDENTKTAYWGSKQGSSVNTFTYGGSILDKENGAVDTSSNCIYKIVGNTIRKYRSDKSEIQSYSIIGYDVAMHKNLRK